MATKKPEAGMHDIPEELRNYFDEESFAVLEYFGLHTPELLNQYSCSVEDAFLETLGKLQQLQQRHSKLEQQFQMLMKALKAPTEEDS